MSIAALAVSEDAIAAQGGATSSGKGNPPPKRTVVATADTVAQPEPR